MVPQSNNPLPIRPLEVASSPGHSHISNAMKTWATPEVLDYVAMVIITDE